MVLESLIALLYDQLPSLEANSILGYLFNSLVTSSHSLELMTLIIFFFVESIITVPYLCLRLVAKSSIAIEVMSLLLVTIILVFF